jgi:virginiamycin B lyase
VGLQSRAALAILAALALILFAAAPPAHGYIYWASFNDNAIGRANNDGSGVNPHFIATGAGPDAVAVDGTHIYWANRTENSIGRANLDGSGVDNAFISGIAGASGVAVNSSKVYWTSFGSAAVGVANLDGSSPNPSLVTGVTTPCGVALDSGHVYWVHDDLSDSSIGRAALNGTSPDPAFVSLSGAFPCGVAVTTGSIFWADSGLFGGGSTIGRANTSNGMGVDTSFIGNQSAPVGVTVFGSQLYWANDGNSTIGRANTDSTGVQSSFISTGGNAIAGVAVDALVPSGVFTIGKLKLDTKHGTAKLPITVQAAGSISLSGQGAQLSAQSAANGKSVTGAGTVTLKIKATGRSKKQLNAQGKVTLKLKITFSPTGGAATTQAKSLKLIKR